MRRVLRPAALATILLFALLPAATVVCQWACAMPAGSAPGDHAHHHATPAPDVAPGSTLLVSDARGCNHTDPAILAVPTPHNTGVDGVAQLALAARVPAAAGPVAVTHPTTSPPSATAAIIPLRI